MHTGLTHACHIHAHHYPHVYTCIQNSCALHVHVSVQRHLCLYVNTCTLILCTHVSKHEYTCHMRTHLCMYSHVPNLCILIHVCVHAGQTPYMHPWSWHPWCSPDSGFSSERLLVLGLVKQACPPSLRSPLSPFGFQGLKESRHRFRGELGCCEYDVGLCGPF